MLLTNSARPTREGRPPFRSRWRAWWHRVCLWTLPLTGRRPTAFLHLNSMTEETPNRTQEQGDLPDPAVVPNSASQAAREPSAEADPASGLDLSADWVRQFNQAREAHLRLAADFENFRRRVVREKDELRAVASASLVEDLLPVLDNLALGVEAARLHHPEASAVTDGMALVLAQLKGVFERHGVSEINPVGERFDPNYHDCLSHLPAEDVDEGCVTAVTRVGYRMRDRLLRPASVVVSSGPPNRPPTPQPEPAADPSA